MTTPRDVAERLIELHGHAGAIEVVVQILDRAPTEFIRERYLSVASEVAALNAAPLVP